MRSTHDRTPKWTLGYNIVCKEGFWIGTGWEFFDDYAVAKERYAQLSTGCFLRPYHKSDREHLGAAHRWSMDSAKQN